jgi:hypothetical protein
MRRRWHRTLNVPPVQVTRNPADKAARIQPSQRVAADRAKNRPGLRRNFGAEDWVVHIWALHASTLIDHPRTQAIQLNRVMRRVIKHTTPRFNHLFSIFGRSYNPHVEVPDARVGVNLGFISVRGSR